jgi:hypothetical protein
MTKRKIPNQRKLCYVKVERHTQSNPNNQFSNHSLTENLLAFNLTPASR